MKKYIGTKQIEAEPMTMGEAYKKACCNPEEYLTTVRSPKLVIMSAIKTVTKAGLRLKRLKRRTSVQIRFLTVFILSEQNCMTNSLSYAHS